jgi:flotillin
MLILITGIFASGCANIKVGEAGVRNNKIISPYTSRPLKTLAPGLVLNVPGMHELTIYNVRETILEIMRESKVPDKKGAEDLDFKTNDGQKLFFDVTVVYQINKEDLVNFHLNVGSSYLKIIKELTLSETRIEVGKYTADEIYQGENHNIINQAVKKRLFDKLKTRGILVHDVVLFKRYEFNEEYQDLVEQAEQAKKQVEINEALARAAEAKAKETEALADGEARAMKKRADARLYEKQKEADGIRAIGEAEAAAKKALADAMGGGENIVQLEFARNIPDKLQIWGIPTGSNSMSFMDLSGLFKNAFTGNTDTVDPAATNPSVESPAPETIEQTVE